MEERRGDLRLVAAAALSAAASGTAACEPALAGAGVERLESARYVLAFRSVPPKLAPGEQFALELAACAKAGAPLPALKVDAHMPAHKHGMNYAPSVEPLGPGRWRAEGLLFHMTGQWEFVFELRAAGKTDRLARGRTLD